MIRCTVDFARRFAALFGGFVVGAVAYAAEPPDFQRHVQPILRKYCAGCHNDDDLEGRLSLATYDGLLKGGEHGTVLTPGAGDQSRLVRVITGQAEPRMPPQGSEAPTSEETQLLAAWITAGARGPSGKAADPADFVTPRIPLQAPVRNSVHAVAVSPQGDVLAIARHGVVELQQVADGRRIAELTGHRGSVNALAFTDDGQWLAAAAGEPNLYGEVRIWRMSDHSLARTVRGNRDSLLSVRASPDGRLLATGGYDQKI